ncbi:CHAT domain-containing protein [Nocardioides scoriae]|uniref:CHAT domain-containing protein n=1 Tax=Nocardioides scoriae TaxID=642780 RepID=A0A1H1QZG5_9ACTN|nr:CHAT domain-containing protein [Nocardioides scoriae]SDS28897.1 CHAT domain-containing protein [Nocardioides scoriae]
MRGGEQLHERAKSALLAGASDRAGALLDRAEAQARRTGHDDLLARVELTRAYRCAEAGDVAEGERRCRAVLDRADLAAVTRGLAWGQLALLRMRVGAVPDALAAFRSALDALPADHPERATVRLNRGNVFLQTGQVPPALADFEQALAETAEDGDPVDRAMLEHNLGCTRLLAGDLVGALRLIDGAAPVLQPLSAVHRATVAQDRAAVLTAAGRPREAAVALRRAASSYGARGLRLSQAECELTLGRTLLREDPAAARVVARRAARRFRGHSGEPRALAADVVVLAAEVALGARSAAVLERCDELAEGLDRHGLRQDVQLLRLLAARVCVRRGDLAGARTRLERVRPRASTPLTTRLLGREVAAELAAARGDRRRAATHVRRGLDELHGWQSSFGSLDLQSTLVGHGRDLAVLGLRQAVTDPDPAALLEWSERARALVSRVPSVRPPADDQVARDLAELRLLLAGPPSPGPRAEELRRRVRERRWYADGPGVRAGDPASREELRAALAEDDAVLLAPVVVDGSMHALAVGGRRDEVRPLGPVGPLRDLLDGLASDLHMAAGHRDGPLAAVLDATVAARLAQVARALVDPVLDLLDGHRVVLTPSGALAGTPWSLLPGLRGRPLTVPPSATRWLQLRGARSASDPGRVVLVAGPGVARAEEEVTRAASAWRTAGAPEPQVLCGADATTRAVAAAAEGGDLLHLAGHGHHAEQNPLFSGLGLVDGPWFGHDVEQLRRVPATVVLSACELGATTLRSGEESVGMSAGWLHAGARTVVSSPVVVADDVACEAFARWHALVAGGTAPADALAEVTAGPDLGWAPLLCFGGGW